MTQDSILDAIARALGNSDGPTDAMTVKEMTREIAQRTGMVNGDYLKNKIRQAVEELRDAGKLEMVNVPIIGVDGRHTKVKGYRLVA